MNERAKVILKTLGVCLGASTVIAVIKLAYGYASGSLAFFADGIHSLFDSGSTVIGMVSVVWSSKPPDEGHPYGHRKFEMVSALILAALLFVAAYEVGSSAYQRLLSPLSFPDVSFMGIAILVVTMGVNLFVARMEAKVAETTASHFLAADSLHNRSDFLITLAVLASILSVQFQIPYVDAGVSLAISIYMVYLAVRLVLFNIKPLVDSSVLDPKRVVEIASTTDGVLHCHNVRSRGEWGHHFLDLNIHLPGPMSLERAHEISHTVEARLKNEFPGLVDVVIHTEPHNHPPCSKNEC